MQKDTPGIVRNSLRYIVLTGAALLLAVVLRTIAPVNGTTVALSFLMLVLVTASRWRLQYSVYVSILCTLLYNYFFLPPVGRLTIQDPRNWVALVAFLGCSVLVSHLSNREHLLSEAAEQRRREVERLYEFSQRLLLQDEPQRLARLIPSTAAAVFGFRAVAMYLREGDHMYASDPHHDLPSGVELKLAAAQGDSSVSSREGCRIIPLSLGMRSAGVLVVTEAGYSLQIYEAIGSMMAIALERAAALERSSRLEASRESERLRSTLLDSVTHDLRTPLTAIRAAATTLVSQPDLPAEERTELTTVVDEESARLDRLIGQAVEMARFDAEAVKIRWRPQGIRELIEVTVEEMRQILRDRVVDVQVEEGLPPIPMDRELVSRALRHLIENAAKYSPPGSPIALSAGRDEYRLMISVTDQGAGIDPSEQPFVFEKFFRGRQYQSTARGTGMGLAIARAILEAHGGGIELMSRQGEGSRFTCWLPMGGSSPSSATADSGAES